MKCKCECIENMEWVKSYENFIQYKQTTIITSLLPTMVDLINKSMNIMTCNAQTVIIITYRVSMHCSINIYISKLLYPHKQDNLTCLIYNDDCFNNKYFDLKVKL